MEIYTIGHSTRPIEEFIALLKASNITVLADVRSIPQSRHVPQYGKDALSAALRDAGITYEWLKDLGGRRRTTKESVNLGWRNESFRGYADYMQTPAFADALGRLIAVAKDETVVLMCAEAVPWRCHRSLIGDALLSRGIAVRDIINATSIRPHTFTSFLKIDGDRLTYPA